ncbi:MAG: HAMP domain-containing protein, partial [Spirochaetia bacterium]|nr:HAMP domain-containing protein [Spirochaetia bacterium]
MSQNWKKEESKIYVRDFIFWLIIVFFSVFIAELFLLKEKAKSVDHLFVYLLVFIPLGTLNLVLHYFYRNRRIRQTGNLRSSLRYRLSLAFMLVSIIPSLPIFFISSNVVDSLVENYFKADLTGALKSARQVLLFYEQKQINEFVSYIKKSQPDTYRDYNASVLIHILKSNSSLSDQTDYRALYLNGKIEYESLKMLDNKNLPEVIKSQDGFDYFTYTDSQGDFIILVFQLRREEGYLLFGKKLHPGMEKDIHHFFEVYSILENEDEWKETIPTVLRLVLALIYIFMIAAALIGSILIARQISFPIVSLAAATRAVTDGKIETKLDIKADGEIGILIESFNQMTEELNNLRAMQMHSQRVAAWQEVAKRLAHEIKNPLTPIQLSADRMLRRLDRPEKGGLEEIVKTGASTIKEQVTLLKSMVEEFANFARMPQAKLKIQNLNSIVMEAVNLFREHKEVSIDTDLDKKLPDILIDKNIILGMVNNLVKNAIEAIPVQENGIKSGVVKISTFHYYERKRSYITLA